MTRHARRSARSVDAVRGGRRRALTIAGLANGILLVPLLFANRRMERAAGIGILGFELSGSWDDAERMRKRLGPQGRAAARASLLLDFPFLVAYGALWWHGTQAAAAALHDEGWSDLAALGGPAGGAALAAASFDVAENLALLQALKGRTRMPYPALARACALTKFALLGTSVPYLLTGASAGAARARRRRSPAR